MIGVESIQKGAGMSSVGERTSESSTVTPKRSRKFWGWAAGIATSVIAAVIAAAISSQMTNQPGVTITGPSTVIYGSEFILTGHANGSYKEAYWTDTFGDQAALSQTGEAAFVCPALGQFTVTLTEVSDNGDETQATHSVTCVS